MDYYTLRIYLYEVPTQLLEMWHLVRYVCFVNTKAT